MIEMGNFIKITTVK